MSIKKAKSIYFIAALHKANLSITELEENISLYSNLTESELLEHVTKFNRIDLVGPCNDKYSKTLKWNKIFWCHKLGDIPFEYYKSNSEYDTLLSKHIVIKRNKDGLYTIIPNSVMRARIDKDQHLYDSLFESVNQMTKCYDEVINSIVTNTKKGTSLINLLMGNNDVNFNLVIMHKKSPDYIEILNDSTEYNLEKIPGTDCYGNLPMDKMKHRLMFAIVSSSRQAEICSRTLDSSNYEEVFAYFVEDTGHAPNINFKTKQLSASEVYKTSVALCEDLGYSPPLDKQIFCGPDPSDKICGFDLM